MCFLRLFRIVAFKDHVLKFKGARIYSKRYVSKKYDFSCIDSIALLLKCIIVI